MELSTVAAAQLITIHSTQLIHLIYYAHTALFAPSMAAILYMLQHHFVYYYSPTYYYRFMQTLRFLIKVIVCVRLINPAIIVSITVILTITDTLAAAPV
jgi:hypothetical protein